VLIPFILLISRVAGSFYKGEEDGDKYEIYRYLPNDCISILSLV
jgi:hypothetical protein